MHPKNHNTRLKNLKTPFNRERWNHNIEFRKHNIKFSGSGLKLNKSSFVIPSIIFGLVGITIICGFVLSQPKSSTSANAVTSTATASVTVPDTCYMSSTSTTHTGTVNGGSYTENFGGESTVTVTCNDRNGYSVYAVGYSNDIEGTNGLIGTSTGLVIPSGTSTSTNISNWAMKLTPGTGTFAPTILSDANGSFASYHIVPTTATKVATLTSDINVSNSSQFKTSYAVAVAPTQAADTYVGKVKYTVVHPNTANSDGCVETPFSGYMQEITAIQVKQACEGVTGTLTDKRDNKTYTVKKINGQLWMTQNLRYLGDTGSAAKTMTIGNGNSNVANKSITLYSLDSSNAGNFNAYDSSKCGSGSTAGYSNACVYDSGSTSTGVWYNYYAASGGTISTNSNSTAASQDICPKNWHLPSGNNTTSGTDINKLVGNTTSGWQAATTGLTAFSAVAGGFYYSGSPFDTGRGFWWSATAYDTMYRYYLLYNSSNGQFYGNNLDFRYRGFFVRCVRSS